MATAVYAHMSDAYVCMYAYMHFCTTPNYREILLRSWGESTQVYTFPTLNTFTWVVHKQHHNDNAASVGMLCILNCLLLCYNKNSS